MSVDQSDIGEQVRDTSIASYSLIDIQERSLEFQLVFSDPDQITPEIQEPDILLIELTNRQDILDVETGEGLDSDQALQTVDLVRQLTSDAYQQIVDAVEAAS